MDKNNQKQILSPKLTPIGRFVHWADSVEVNGKILKLSILIWAAAFVIGQQDSNWSFFRGQPVVRAEGELPQLAPEKAIMADSALRCDNARIGADQNADKRGNLGKNIIGALSVDQFLVKKNIENLIGNKPMEQMVEALAQQDPQTASYMVAIAKKESNLGQIAPKDANGQDCYNYWGFRGPQNTTQSGYSCFATPAQAVAAVGDRIQYLTQVGDYNTPQKMSVWKCGFDCSWDNQTAVKKWISDVSFYYGKLTNNL